MPKVTQYNPNQVATKITPGAVARDVPAGAFSSGLVADVAESFSGTLKSIHDDMQETAAEEALNNFNADTNDLFFKGENAYFNTQGVNAMDQAASTNEALEKSRQQYSETLTGTARRAFDKSSNGYVVRAKSDILRHSAKGAAAWKAGTQKAIVENSLESGWLYWNQPERNEEQRLLGEQAVIDSSSTSGMSPEETAEAVQTYNSSFVTGTIKAATASSAANGKNAMAKYGDSLEGQQITKMNELIDAKVKEEKTSNVASAGILNAGKLFDQYGDNRADIMKDIAKIKDPLVRKATSREADYLLSQNKTIELEEQSDIYRRVYTQSRDNPDFSLNAFIANEPEYWDKLTLKQQDTLLAGEGGGSGTDKVVYTNLMTLPDEELARINPLDYITDFNDTDYKALVKAIKSVNDELSDKDKVNAQQGRTRNAQTKSIVEDQIFRGVNMSNEGNEQKLNSIYRMIDDEYKSRVDQKGAALSSDEYTQLLKDMSGDIVKSGRLWGTNTTDAIEIYDKIGMDNASGVADMMRSAGVRVNTKSMLDTYQRLPEMAKQLEARGKAVTKRNITKYYQMLIAQERFSETR